MSEMSRERCPNADRCQHGDSGCYGDLPCVRFPPNEGTNLIKIYGVLEVPPFINSDLFCQYFSNWVESMGWLFSGGIGPYEEETK